MSFFPQTAYSFSNIDQAVGTAAGATILAFASCNIVKARCERQGRRDTASPVSTGIELEARVQTEAPELQYGVDDARIDANIHQ